MNDKLQKIDAQFNYQYIWHLRSRDSRDIDSYVVGVDVFGNVMKLYNFEYYMSRITIGFEI